MNTSRDPVRARVRIGHWALAVRVMPEADRREVLEARLPASGWPAKMLKVTAVDARTGEFVVFDSAGEAGLVDAVGASCTVPGVWPPVTIGNRRFMDGGVRSVANADLAARYERVVIVAPVARLNDGEGQGERAPSRCYLKSVSDVYDVAGRAFELRGGRVTLQLAVSTTHRKLCHPRDLRLSSCCCRF